MAKVPESFAAGSTQVDEAMARAIRAQHDRDVHRAEGVAQTAGVSVRRTARSSATSNATKIAPGQRLR